MDIVTQGLLGGVLAQTAANEKEVRRATLVGVFAGLLADADILIGSSQDPLLTIEFHRHFTHSLLFIPFGALVACLLLWPFMRRHLTVPRLYMFCLLGYSMSGVLDACTSYGTHLFWPFSDERVSWRIISIIDPLFTGILLLSLITGLRLKRNRVAQLGLLLCGIYLLLGFIQLQRAQQLATDLAKSRGHITAKHIVKPTLGNMILWRSVYLSNEQIYVDAIRTGIFSNGRVYPGEHVKHFKPHQDIPGLDTTSVLYTDIQRFTRFSEGFVAYDPTQANVIGDTRYSLLATSVQPLWGIVIDTSKPGQHADYRFFRANDKAQRQRFVDMLFGREI